MAVPCRCGCGQPVPLNSGPGRPRAYLPEHSPDKRKRDRRVVRSVPAVPSAQASVSPLRPPAAGPSLVESTRARLTEVGRDGSPEGLVALLLASELMAGGGSQSGLAALAKQFQVALDFATKDASQSADVIDGIFGT